MAISPDVSEAVNQALRQKAGPNDYHAFNSLIKCLLAQPEESQAQLAQWIVEKLLRDASQPRQAAGNSQACARLCGFVQQCAKLGDERIRAWTFAEPLSLSLFRFYLEYFEHDPHRSMRLVLDVLAMAIASNPCPSVGVLIKEHILESIVSIAARRSAKHFPKSGLQSLDYFLAKRIITTDDVGARFRKVIELPEANPPDDLYLWDLFVSRLFSWMELPYVSPLVGKCLVHVFSGLKTKPFAVSKLNLQLSTPQIWYRWLQAAIVEHPAFLEDTKHYVLEPLFKKDKETSLELLRIYNSGSSSTTAEEGESSDATLMLQLATLEVGKKFGLVEEPGTEVRHSSGKIALREDMLEILLLHPSLHVRSSAVCLLVSSPATGKPLSPAAFSLLRKYLPVLSADYDAKFRTDFLAYTKFLVERVKNVITAAQKSLDVRLDVGLKHDENLTTIKRRGPEAALGNEATTRQLLKSHREFLTWYMDGFLRDELVPTASYQRHVTALKAAVSLLTHGKTSAHGPTPSSSRTRGLAPEVCVDIEMVQKMASDPAWIRLAMDLITDPFDDVRNMAVTLLRVFPAEVIAQPSPCFPGFHTLLDILHQLCDRASALATKTSRANYGDGAARAAGLLFTWTRQPDLQVELMESLTRRVEDKVAQAEKDLGRAAMESPVHGDFAALSHVWQVLVTQPSFNTAQQDALNQIQRWILDCCRRIWKAVAHVLCDDSPEGHLLEDMEETEGLDTKDLLSYSFRAVHESSNLLRLIVGTLRSDVVEGAISPSLHIFTEASALTFEQLSTLRHRGALSTVSLTFTTCCQITTRLPIMFPDDSGAKGLLWNWYQGTLACINTQASTTRRSAGIPPLIASILAADAASPSFEEVILTLDGIAKRPTRIAETDGSSLPQVHAHNCLREAFRSSLLSKKAETYLAMTLHLAVGSLKSEVWAIRNCGLLLLRSVIDCLLGTGDSKVGIEAGWDGQGVRISYTKYPTLPGVLVGLLKSGAAGEEEEEEDHPGLPLATSSSSPAHEFPPQTEPGQRQPARSPAAPRKAAAEAVFPALDIIRRAGPPDEHRDELRALVEAYLANRLWHVREMAARTLCSFFLGGGELGGWASEAKRLLDRFGAAANGLHGVLLTIKFVTERKVELGDSKVAGESMEVATLLEKLAATNDHRLRDCPEIKAACLEILSLVADLVPDYQVPAIFVVTRPRVVPSALFDLQTSLLVARQAAGRHDASALKAHIHSLLDRASVNTACAVLEKMPVVWQSALTGPTGPRAQAELYSCYTEVIRRAESSEVRAQALLNLAGLLERVLALAGKNTAAGGEGVETSSLPDAEELVSLWGELFRSCDINPALACSVLRASGAIMATLDCHLHRQRHCVEAEKLRQQRLRKWGAMVADALDVDNVRTGLTSHA